MNSLSHHVGFLRAQRAKTREKAAQDTLIWLFARLLLVG
jgi:hypothetical protein